MCDAGRIRHHLKHNLWRPECAVVFVGYQAEGSLGRRLLEGAKSVKLFGEEIAVNARIVNFKGLSSHADRDHLLAWIEHFAPTPQQVFVVHGDSEVTDLFAKDLNARNIPAHAPLYEEVYDLSANAMLAKGVVLEPKKTTGGAAAGSPAFVRLQTCPNSWRPSSAAAGAAPTRTWPGWPTRSNRSWRTGRTDRGLRLRLRTTGRNFYAYGTQPPGAEGPGPGADAGDPPALLAGHTGLPPADHRGVHAGRSDGGRQFTFPPSSGDTLPLFLYLLILLYTTVMNFGYQIWALRVYRRQQAGYGTLIDGFSMAGRVLLMELYIFGCTLCWTLAFGTAAGLMLFMLGWLPPVLLVLLFYGAVFGITLWISYRYALAPFLLMDRRRRGPIAPVRRAWP